MQEPEQGQGRAVEGDFADERYFQGVVDSFRHVSPFAASLSQAVTTPAGEDRDTELVKRGSRPLSPLSTTLKPPKHPRSLSATMNSLKL